MRLVDLDGVFWVNPDRVIGVERTGDTRTAVFLSDADVIHVDLPVPEVVAKLTAQEPQGLATTVSSGTAFVGPTKAEKALKEIVGMIDTIQSHPPELRMAPGKVITEIYKTAKEASE